MTMCSKNFGGHGPVSPPGYAYVPLPTLVTSLVLCNINWKIFPK